MVDMARNHSKNTNYYETIVSYSISGLKVQNWVQNLSPNSFFLGITAVKPTNLIFFQSVKRKYGWKPIKKHKTILYLRFWVIWDEFGTNLGQNLGPEPDSTHNCS